MKFFLPAINAYPAWASTTVKSKWVLLVFVLPVILYMILRSFETELTHFIIPFFPVEPDKSFGFYRDFLRLCFNEMLWLSLFFLLAWILFVYVPVFNVVDRIDQYVIQRSATASAFIVCLSFLSFVLIAYYTLRAFPNSADEYVYLYQAETLSHGKLWNEAHSLEDFYLYSHIAQKEGISVGRFPPGWPILLSLPFVIGFPVFWLNPILAAITLILFYRFSKKHYGDRVALWSLVSLTFTSFFIFNSASYFSHTACLLFVLGFVFCLYESLRKPSTIHGLLAGAFLGLTVITRYYNAVLIFIPVLAYLAFQYKWKSIRTLFLIGLGTLPFFILLFWYNYKITGDGFLPVTVWADKREGLGFGVMGYTPIEGIEHFIRRVLLFLYWCSPGLLILYFIFLYQKLTNRVEQFLHPEDYFVLMMIIGYYFYYHIGGNQYGPRFWFEGLPFLVLFVVKKVFDARAKWTLALFLAGLIYGLIKMPYIIQREHQIVMERMDIYDLAKKTGIKHAVVLVASHTGIIRPMGIMDLIRNDLEYENDVLYVHDLPEKNAQLMKHYPDRSFYRYVRNPEKVGGHFIRLK